MDFIFLLGRKGMEREEKEIGFRGKWPQKRGEGKREGVDSPSLYGWILEQRTRERPTWKLPKLPLFPGP